MDKKNASHLSYAQGKPQSAGVLRSLPEDFYVNEVLGFEPSGSGEHVFLFIEKKGLTSFFVRDQIAKLANCALMDVGYSGLKDRQAVTRQWFSVYDPQQQVIDWTALNQVAENDLDNPNAQTISVLTVTRHNKKIKRGVHKKNDFRLVVKGLEGDLDDLQKRLDAINKKGFPNYFGEQRFGRNANNIKMIETYFATKKKNRKRLPRDKKSLGLSSARSCIFNDFLSTRINDDNWTHYIEGDRLILNGTNSFFSRENNTASQEGSDFISDIESRLALGDVHIAGPLWGVSAKTQDSATPEPLDTPSTQNYLQALAQNYSVLTRGLEKEGVKMAYRPLRAYPQNFNFALSEQQLVLEFSLSKGSYATSLVRELVNT